MPSPHLLLIKDDPDIARVLCPDLEDAGFEVTHATSAMHGLIQARETPPDLLLLDLGLPDFDGSRVVTRLRRTTSVPIIALTARDGAEEKVRVLNLGADDDVVKPAHPSELLARVRGQLRLPHTSALTLGELEVCPA